MTDNLMRKTLIIFTRNEMAGIRSIYPKIPLDLFDEIFAIDGHSTDGTIQFLESVGVPVRAQKRMGRVNATIEAMEHASGDTIVFLSADGNEDPRDIPRLLAALNGNDLALTSRFMRGGRTDDTDDPLRFRRAMSIILAKLVSLAWGVQVTDATNGLRAVKRSLWERAKIRPGYHSAELQLVIRAARMRARVAEIPTVEGQRVGHIRYASTVRMAVSLLKVFVRELLALA